jgi:hypothetical protein
VYLNIRNTLPKFGTFLLGHSVYIYIYKVLPATPSRDAIDEDGKKHLSTFSEALKKCEKSLLLEKNSFQKLEFFFRNVDPHSAGIRCVLFDFLRQVMWKRGSETSAG